MFCITCALDFYILESIIACSVEIDVDDEILTHCIVINVLSVPMNEMSLSLEVEQRHVAVGVCPAMSFDGANVSLGNASVGGFVWCPALLPLLWFLSPPLCNVA